MDMDVCVCVCAKVLYCRTRLVSYLPGLHVLVNRVATAGAFSGSRPVVSDEPPITIFPSDLGIGHLSFFYIIIIYYYNIYNIIYIIIFYIVFLNPHQLTFAFLLCLRMADSVP